MNVLIVGGCGFLGAHIAEKLHKEGHNVCIIDVATNNLKRKFTFKITSLHCSADSEECETFFALYNFDVVIYAVHSLDSIYSKNLAGLLNILELVHKYKVEKTIVLTDKDNSAVQCCDREYKFFCRQKENYCKNWAVEFKSSVILLKIANVYGPGMLASKYRSAITSILKADMVEADEILQYHPQNYIYIDDLLEVINKIVLGKNLPAVLTVADNIAVTAKALQKIIAAVKENKTYIEEKDDFVADKDDNSNLCKEVLKYQLRYTLFSGLCKMNKWQGEEAVVNERNQTNGFANVKKNLKKFSPYFENIILAIFTGFISIHFDTSSNMELMTGLDYSQIYILILGLVYGKKQALIAAAFSVLIFFLKIHLKGIDIVAIFYDVDYTVHLIAYLFMAVITGYITDKNRFNIENVKYEQKRMSINQNFWQKSYKEAIRLKNKFYRQIVNSRDNIGWLYNSINKLYNVKSEKIYSAAIDVVTELLDTENATIVVVSRTANGNNKFLRLKIRRGKATEKLPVSMQVSDYDYLDKVINKKQTFVNKTLEPKVPDMAVPVILNNEVIAAIGIYDIPFEYFSLHYEKMLRIVSMMLAEALQQANIYEKDTHDKRYLEDTVIMKETAFREIENILKQRDKNDYCKFRIDEVNGVPMQPNITTIINAAPYLRGTTREQDYIGVIDNRIYILMEELPANMVDVIKKRFLAKNIKISLTGD